MCCWMGSHFHDWIEYDGAAFLIELLEWGHTFSDSYLRLAKKAYLNVCTVGEKQSFLPSV